MLKVIKLKINGKEQETAVDDRELSCWIPFAAWASHP